MKCKHHSVEFEIPDSWIDEAGMRNFIPNSKCHPADETKVPGQKIFDVKVDLVEPLIEGAKKKGVFCDSADTGESAKDRVLRILELFKTNQEIEPVKVTASETNDFEYKLTQGSHRFHCAIAMGYKMVPATEDRVHGALSA